MSGSKVSYSGKVVYSRKKKKKIQNEIVKAMADLNMDW